MMPLNIFFEKLAVHFAIKDLGELHYFLGLEVSRQHGDLILSQGKYAADLIAKVGLTQCSTCPTHLHTTDKLRLHDGSPIGPEDATNYRSGVGALQ
jgi:histone deacetylase 1/2